MAKTQTKSHSLVELAKQKKPTRHVRPTNNFVTRLPVEQQEQLLELRDKYAAGELDPEWTPRSLLKEIVEPAGIQLDITFNSWRRWLYEAQHANARKI